MPDEEGRERDLEVLIETGVAGPIAIGVAESLLQEAGIPYFVMDQRQEGGEFLGWLDIRVPGEREAEAREILRSLEEAE